MKSILSAFFATILSIFSADGGTRSSASYSIPTDSTDSAGLNLQSANYFINGSAVGEFGASQNALITSAAYTEKGGFVGQLYDIVALSITAPPSTNLNETANRQLNAAPQADDTTTLATIDPSTVTWSIIGGPITSISSSGLATAGNVYQDTSATVGGAAQSLSGQLNLTILNVTNDDFGPYANDGIDDSWQVQYFGQNNPNAGPNVDADGDGESNLSEFRSGTDPTDPLSVIHSARQLDISTRIRVLTGDNVLIGGFVIKGPTAKKVIVRAMGPSLTAAGVPNVLADPTLELHDHTGAIIATNDNWKVPDQANIQATGFAPGNDNESAIVQTLAPASYTAIVRGVGDTTGVGLVEVYDLGDSTVKLANLSSRGFVDTGDNVMIGGFVVGKGLGNAGTGTSKVLVRGIGPSLANFGVANPLPDPTLELHDGNGNTLASNDNWKVPDQTAIQATGLAPTNDLESAILVTLPKGAYTAIVRGNNSATGVGLVEVYTLK